MAAPDQLRRPWLVAVWPGMGNVAITAGYYLMAKLGMQGVAEYGDDDLFDIDHIEVRGGLLQRARMPRNRFFHWEDPRQRHDLLLFIGEAQPPVGKYLFCRKLIEQAESFGVERVFTFAAMATQMRPEQPSRVFCAATERETLERLTDAHLQVVDDGHIGGLNGVLLGAAADRGLPGACLLGEIPHVFAQIPYPKGSLAVLKAFSKIADVEVDLEELTRQAEATDEQLSALIEKMEAAVRQQSGEAEEESFSPEPEEEPKLQPEDEARIEELFDQARQDQSRAFELKQELDRLQVFQDYEDRFLDLFKNRD